MLAVAMPGDVGGESLDEGLCIDRFGGFGQGDRLDDGLLSHKGAVRFGSKHGIEWVLGRLGLGDQMLRQPHLERPVEPEQELGACDAVEAEIPVEFAIEANRWG
jgi:hypothetical protein